LGKIIQADNGLMRVERRRKGDSYN
jgi:hypothetical protein